MPAKPASKKAQQKRLHVTDTAGWTHIVRGSQAQKNQKSLTPVDKLQPTQVAKGLTIQNACDKLDRYRKAWGESQHHEQVQNILEHHVLVAGMVSINRCVCLGLGSMTGTSSDDSSWHQLAILMSVLDILGWFTHMHHRFFWSFTVTAKQLQGPSTKLKTSMFKTQSSITWILHCSKVWDTQ